jgi:hypothetical protein
MMQQRPDKTELLAAVARFPPEREVKPAIRILRWRSGSSSPPA